MSVEIFDKSKSVDTRPLVENVISYERLLLSGQDYIGKSLVFYRTDDINFDSGIGILRQIDPNTGTIVFVNCVIRSKENSVYTGVEVKEDLSKDYTFFLATVEWVMSFMRKAISEAASKNIQKNYETLSI